MNDLKDRQTLTRDIRVPRAAGVRLHQACETAGIGVRTLLIRPNEVLSGIAHARVLKVADHTLRIVVQHPHMRTGCLA